MSSNQHQTNPNRLLAAKWQKAAKAILNDEINLYVYRGLSVEDTGELNPYRWLSVRKDMLLQLCDFAIPEQVPIEVQALFCLFIAEFILTDGDNPNAN